MSKEIIQITDYDINNARLLSQFKKKEKAIQVMQAISKRSNDIEQAIFEVRDYFWLDTAQGIQLDIIGKIHGEARLGRNDTDYRAAIKIRIQVNNGSGDPETVILVVTGIFGATNVQLIFSGNATIYIWADSPLLVDQYNQLLDIIDAGVQLIFVAGSSNPFVFYNDPDGAGYSYLISDELEIDSGDGTGIELLDIDPSTGTENLFVFNYQNLEGFEIDFGSGETLFSVDFGSGIPCYFLINFLSTMFGYQSIQGGEYQSILIE